MRGRVRKTIGKLRDLRVQPKTLKAYHQALECFLKWLDGCRRDLPASADDMDGALQDFAEECWESGDAKSVVGYALSAVTHEIPNLRGHLKGTWSLLKTWQQHELPDRALVIVKKQVEAMIGYALREKRHDLAAAYSAGFSELLRPGELGLLLASNVTFSRDGAKAVLDLGFTKSGKRLGRREKVVSVDPETNLLLSLVLLGRSPGTKLLPLGVPEFRKAFARHTQAIGSDSALVKPYSLRRGGATHHFAQKGNLQATGEKGRWRQLATARLYIDEAASEVAQMELTAKQLKMVEKGRKWLRKLLM